MSAVTNVGIWIDHQKAIIVNAAPVGVTVRTMASDVAPHPRFAGGLAGAGEQHYEARFEQQLAHFYDQVIAAVGHPDGLIILGPGEAKQQLRKRLASHKPMGTVDVAVEAMDAMTEPQIVAKVKTHFGLQR